MNERHPCLARSALILLFHRIQGCTPLSFLFNHHIDHVLKLLAEGHVQLHKLAYECGFLDINYFNRLFRKRAGITPVRFQDMAMRLG